MMRTIKACIEARERSRTMQTRLRTTIAVLALAALIAAPAQARVELVWGDANGFTIDGVSVFDHGTSELLAQLILTPGAPVPPDPNTIDGVGSTDVLLAAVTMIVDAANPNVAFLENFGALVPPPLPGETVFVRVFAATSVASGVRYAEASVVTVQDITVQPPQPVTFTGAPPATGFGAPPQELNLTVVDPTANLPIAHSVRLGEARPNPFNPRTVLTLRVPAGGAEVIVAVFDVRGRRVGTLTNGWRPEGEYRLQWQGIDAEGRPLPSGVYRARLQNGDDTQVRSMVLVR